MKKLILFLIFFLISSVSAYTYISIDLDNTGNSIFLGSTTENISIPDMLVDKGIITGISEQFTSKQGELWTFEYVLQGSNIELILPEGAEIESSSSQSIKLKNNRLIISAKDSIKLSYSINKVSKDYSTYSVILITIIILFTLAIYSAYYYFKKIIPSRNKLEIIKKVLNDRENIILENLKKSGKIKMSHLRRLSEIPKASFSRHIKVLETKKLIVLSGEGKNKFVQISRYL